MRQRLPKFQPQPQAVANHVFVDRDFVIIATIARYRVISTSLLLSLVGGSPRRVYDRLKVLFHKGLIQRVPGSPNEEVVYYLNNLDALRLLANRSQLPAEQLPEWNSVRNNQKLGRPPSFLTLVHELMISHFHAGLELACRRSRGQVELLSWRQGPELRDKVTLAKTVYDKNSGEWSEADGRETLAHEPDAFFTLRLGETRDDAPEELLHYMYEADRKTTDTTRFKKKLRSHFHYVVAQKKHQEKYGVQRIRAVLIHTLDRSWAGQLRQAAMDPIVSAKPSPLFWFTPSEFLGEPYGVFDEIWASPVDNTLYSLLGSVAIPQEAILKPQADSGLSQIYEQKL